MYSAPSSPGSNELNEYERHPPATGPFEFTGPVDWWWTQAPEQGEGKLSLLPPASFVAYKPDGAQIKGAPLAAVGGAWRYKEPIPNGYYVAGLDKGVGKVLRKGFTVNNTGQPLPNPTPGTSPTRYEMNYRTTGGTAHLFVPYKGLVKPKVYHLKSRGGTAYSHRTTLDDLYARSIHLDTGNDNTLRYFCELINGDIAIHAGQKYNRLMTGIGIGPPQFPLQDGPRGQGLLGYLYEGVMGDDDSGYYWVDVLGRVGHTGIVGDCNITTFAGWRIKPGELPAHPAYRTSTDPAKRAFYVSKWELVGDWSRVRGPAGFAELWGMAILRDRRPEVRGFHEMLLADTRHNRILYLNHFTAHGPAGYRKPDHPPLGYVAPDAPTGQSQLVTFLDAESPGITPEMVAGVWSVKQSPFDGTIIWNTYDTGLWCCCEWDGSNPRIIGRTAVYLTDFSLGIQQRLGDGKPATVCRRMMVDGPMGVAVTARTQGWDFDIDGNVVFADKHFFALRKLDIRTGAIKTETLLPMGENSEGGTDLALVIDRLGKVGPAGDRFATGWKQSDFRLDKDGQWVGHIYAHGKGGQSTIHNGVASQAMYPGYAWLIVIGNHGRWLGQGNSSGWQDKEYTLRVQSDQYIDAARYNRGLGAFARSLALAHGPYGRGRLGFPTIDDIGSWPVEQQRAYFTEWKVPADFLEDTLLFTAVETRDNNYSGVIEPPPPPPPPPPDPVDCVLSEWSAWTPTSEWSECIDGLQSRTEKRTRTVLVPAANGGKACGPLEETEPRTRPCVMPPPPDPDPTEIELLRAEVTRLSGEVDKAEGQIERIAPLANSITEITKE